MNLFVETLFSNVATVYLFTTAIMSVGLILMSIEDLKNRSIYQAGGMLSWKISRLTSKSFTYGSISRVMDFLNGDRIFKCCSYARLGVSFCLFFLACCGVNSSVLIGIAFLLFISLGWRSPYGLDGAYQMGLVILFSLLIGSVSGTGSPISRYSLFFIAAQLILSYFISGIVKLFSQVWRKEYALNMIFSTKSFGHELVYNILRKNRLLTSSVSYFVVLFEVLFVLIFIINPLLGACLGFLFHLSNAAFMGLNNFFLPLWLLTPRYSIVIFS